VARILALVAVAYALSPIDLIPDFIPFLGQLDDLILVPAALALALRHIPPGVMADARAKAGVQVAKVRRGAWIAAGVIVGVWVLILLGLYLLFRHFTAPRA
jgi:uncharacterized membrane protein YkvA (DUF1232 family)